MNTINQHHRKPIRLKEYDYSQPGEYFITICTHDHECTFGEIVDGKMRLNKIGKIVQEEWLRTSFIRPGIELDIFKNKMPCRAGQHSQASGCPIIYTVSS
jgi:hypothetical protein